MEIKDYFTKGLCAVHIETNRTGNISQRVTFELVEIVFADGVEIRDIAELRLPSLQEVVNWRASQGFFTPPVQQQQADGSWLIVA